MKKYNKEIKWGIIGLSLIAISSICIDTFLKTDKKVLITFNNKQEQKKYNFIVKHSKEIFNIKPDLIVNQDIIIRFGGSCPGETKRVFNVLNIKEVNKDNYMEALNVFAKSPFFKKYALNVQRSLIMLKYAIQTKTFPNTNGTMKVDLFKDI